MKAFLLFSLLLLLSKAISAGPYEPAAGQTGSTAIHKDDNNIIQWATDVDSYSPGTMVNVPYDNPVESLGSAEGNVTSGIVSLGSGGSITLRFPGPIQNGDGWDFVVFENGFTDDFLELARVQVSSDGLNFVEFSGISITANPVGTFSTIDTSNIANTITNAITLESWNTGYAGKYRAGWGTPYDLDWFIATGQDGVNVDVNHITHIRIIDIRGDGSFRDIFNNAVYDPYPVTSPGGGFDLDGIGVRYIESIPSVPVPIPYCFQFFLFITLLSVMKHYSMRHNGIF